MKTKLLGVVLMSSALLLQVGYAATTTEYAPLNNTQAFDVYFADPVILRADSGIQVEMTEGTGTDKGSLDIQVGNMYPGAGFAFETTIYNDGNTDARVADILIDVKEKGTEGGHDYNTELMDMLVGYDTSKEAYTTLEAYRNYLVDTYEDKVIKQGETLPICFSMAMNEAEEGRQNQEVVFSVRLQFAQVETGGGGGTGTTNPDPDPDPDDPDDPDEETPGPGTTPGGEDPEVDIPDEPIPGGSTDPGTDPGTTTGTTPGGEDPEVDIPDEAIPGGSTDPGTTPGGEDPEVTIPDESIPGGAKLPQTGGMTPYIVYGAGSLMMLSGLFCCRRKETKK